MEHTSSLSISDICDDVMFMILDLLEYYNTCIVNLSSTCKHFNNLCHRWGYQKLTNKRRNLPSSYNNYLKLYRLPLTWFNYGKHTTLSDVIYVTSNGVKVKGPNNHNILLGACRHGHADVVQFLISKKADLMTGHSACLHETGACDGNLDIVKMLIEAPRGAKVNTGSYAILDACVEYNYLHIMKYLVSVGISINLNINKYFCHACKYGDSHTEMVQYLLSIDKSGRIKLHSGLIRAIRSDANIEFIRLLLPPDDQYFYVDYQNGVMFAEATKLNRVDILEELLKYKHISDVGIKYKYRNIIETAVENKKYDVIKFIYDRLKDDKEKHDIIWYNIRLCIHRDDLDTLKFLVDELNYDLTKLKDDSIVRCVLDIILSNQFELLRYLVSKIPDLLSKKNHKIIGSIKLKDEMMKLLEENGVNVHII